MADLIISGEKKIINKIKNMVSEKFGHSVRMSNDLFREYWRSEFIEKIENDCYMDNYTEDDLNIMINNFLEDDDCYDIINDAVNNTYWNYIIKDISKID